jgi:PAS domain S-box-containing protein
VTSLRPARGLWPTYLLAGIAATVVYHLWASPLVQTLIVLTLTIGAFGALLAGMRMHGPARRLPWRLLAAGQTAAFASWLVWQYGILTHGHAAESGSIVDVFWVVNSVAVLGAIALLMRARDPGSAAMLDSGVVACALALVASIVLLAPAMETQSGAGLAAFLAYALLDTAMLAVLARLVLRGTVRVPAGALLLGGVLALFSTDVAYTWLGATGSYSPGAWADLGWVLFPVLVGAAALHPSMASLFNPGVRRDDTFSLPYVLVLGAALLIVPALMGIELVRGTEIETPIALVLSTVLSLLVLIRLTSLIRQGGELRRSLAEQNRELRERTAAVELLREIAEATDGSSSTEEALARAIEAICNATGWPIGHAYIKERGFPQLTPTRIWHLDDAPRWEPFVRLSKSLHFVAGHGLPGRVLETAGPVWVTSSDVDPTRPRAEVAREVGIRTAFAFPVLVEGEAAAVLEFFSPETIEEDPRIDELSRAVGNQLARVLERSRAEAALRANEERFRGLVANVPGAIYRTSLEGGRTVEYVSDHIEEIIGHSAADFVSGRVSPLEVIHPDDLERVDATVHDAVEQHVEIELEYRMVHADGTVRWVSETGRPVRNDVTGETFFDGVIVDVTERRRAEEELRRLALIVESSGDAIFGLTLDGRVTSWNAAAEELTGYPAAEMIGRRISAVLPEEYHADLTRVAERVRSGERVAAFETQLLKRCGGRAEISLSAGLISGEAGVAVTVRDITAAKEAERRLREAEDRYRTLVEQLPLATYIDAPDAQGGSTYLSPQIEQIVGYAPSEWLADRDLFKKVLHPEDRDRVLAEVRRATLADEPVQQEYRVIAKDGRTVWLRDSAVVVRGEDGTATYRQGYVIDTTAQKATEAQLRDSEERTRLLFDTALDAVVSMDAEGCITDWNAQAEAVFGWTRDEAVGRKLGDTIVPERYRAAHVKGLKRFLSGGEGRVVNRRIEIEALARDGREFPIELAIVPIERNGSYEFSAFLRDISERKDADERLREAEERYRVLVEQLPVITYIDLPGDPDGDLWLPHYVSSQLEPMLGWSREEWMSYPDFYFDQIVHPDDREEVLRAHDVALVREAGHTIEHRLLHRDGSVRWYVDHMVIARDPEGRPLWAQGYLLDITEQKRAKAELERSLERERAQNAELRTLDTMKDEFIALVSHELRTPLTSIRGYLELVLEGSGGELSEEQRQFIAVAQRNADRLQSLVGDLLFIAQIEAGRLSLERSDVDLLTVAQESVESGRPLAATKNIALSLAAKPVGTMVGDRGRLGQLLDNFVSNAIKFTPAGGSVDVRLSASASGTAVLEVSDTGMGIPADEQERLFERFFRSSTATAQAIQGTGLGLTICKAIAEAHGGRITFTSVENEGTTFRIELPLAGQLQEAA